MDLSFFIFYYFIIVLIMATSPIQGRQLSDAQCVANTDLHTYFEKGKRLTGKVFQKEEMCSLRRCIEECLVQRRCGQITYHETNWVCELASNTTTVSATDDQKYMTGNRESWSTELDHLAGACSEHSCTNSQKCIPLWAGQVHCLDLCVRDGWVYHDSKCYFFSTVAAEGFDAAQVECAKLDGASLARVETARVNEFILEEMTITGVWNVYFSANDRLEEGVWRWGDTTENVTYMDNWIAGQPDNGDSDGGEDCAQLLYNAIWGDLPCDKGDAYICEKEV